MSGIKKGEFHDLVVNSNVGLVNVCRLEGLEVVGPNVNGENLDNRQKNVLVAPHKDKSQVLDIDRIISIS